MKIPIQVSMTVTVDPAAWDDIYGTGTKPATVRADVRGYLLNAVRSQPGIEESGATVTENDEDSPSSWSSADLHTLILTAGEITATYGIRDRDDVLSKRQRAILLHAARDYQEHIS